MATSPCLESLKESCRKFSGRLAFPESEDDRILTVASRIQAESIAAVTMVGEKDAIVRRCAALGLPAGSVASMRFVGVRDDGALHTAARLLADGDVDAVLAGAVETTADVIRAGIGGVGLAAGVRTVSGSFLMEGPEGQLYLFADCGVVIAPSQRQLKDIAVESVKTWRALLPDREPAVAFLSYSTAGSADHETAKKMAGACADFQQALPNVKAYGEIQFDAAIDAAIGERKAPGNPLAGGANCFVFPDLGAGNIAYKLTQRLAGYHAYGPILQGLAKPFSDLSRGSTLADIEASAYINLVRAHASPD